MMYITLLVMALDIMVETFYLPNPIGPQFFPNINFCNSHDLSAKFISAALLNLLDRRCENDLSMPRHVDPYGMV